jgi:hypothetical protein
MATPPAWHNYIADQQVDTMPALLEHTECFFPVGRCQNAISMLFQGRCDESPHPLFVLHQQNAPAAPGRRLGGCFQYHDSFDHRKENRKRW